MQHEYDEWGSGEAPSLSDDEMYFQHVIGDDHELLAMDIMLANALSPLDE